MTGAEQIAKVFDANRNVHAVHFSGDNMKVSDRYHTMDELYEHRAALFMALCRTIDTMCSALNSANGQNVRCAWRSKKHSDGTMFDGMFVMGINVNAGQQITYHFDLSKWDDTNFAKTLDIAPPFDGHTPDDVIARLKAL